MFVCAQGIKQGQGCFGNCGAWSPDNQLDNPVMEFMRLKPSYMHARTQTPGLQLHRRLPGRDGLLCLLHGAKLRPGEKAAAAGFCDVPNSAVCKCFWCVTKNNSTFTSEPS